MFRLCTFIANGTTDITSDEYKTSSTLAIEKKIVHG